MKILFLPGSLIAPASRFRILQFIPYLQKLGYQVEVRVTTPNRYWSHSNNLINRLGSVCRVVSAGYILKDAEKFDIIFMNRDIVPETSVTFWEKFLFKKNSNIVFDFDDAIFNGLRHHKLVKILPLFKAVVAGNEYLASYAKEYNQNVHVWPTVVDTTKYIIKQNMIHDPIRVGWSGSMSSFNISRDLTIDFLKSLIKHIKFEFVVISDGINDINIEGLNVHYYKWNEEEEAELLHNFDIGIMLLNDGVTERGKCGAKLIQYGAAGIPSIASDVGVNNKIIKNGETGYIINSVGEAVNQILMLNNNAKLSTLMGLAARKHIEQEYSIKYIMPQITQLFNHLILENR